MTPEKRPAEEDAETEEKASKKQKEDGNDTSNVIEENHDESSQDSVSSDSNVTQGGSSSDSDPSKQRLSLPEGKGTLVFCGCTQWDFIGRRNLKCIPSMMHFAPRIWQPMKGIKICYVAAHCSSAHGVIITAEGKVMTFGRNEKGQLGTGDTENRNVPVMLDSIKDLTVVAAAVGRNHSLFLTDRGSVFSCGDNKSGQCGVGNTTSIIHTPCRISFKESKVVKIACGADFSMIIDKRGYLYSFGLPEYGQLGHNTDGKFFVSSNKLTYQFETSPRRVPVFVERSKDGHPTPVTDVKIVDIACGNNHSVAIDSKKRAYSWGFGGYGRLGHSDPKDEMVPRIIKFFDGPKRGVLQAFCGATFTIAITELGVYLWGQTKRTGEANMYPKPLQDLFGWEVRNIGCSATSIVVAAERSVISWGPSPTYGELGLGENTKSSTQPKEVKALDGALVHQVACSLGFTLMVANDDDEEDKAVLSKLKEIEA
ncbi:Protein RCC2-like protein [Armadillidium nasatum]|uniref:Protein RCC2-like protein n=1 Tax=Armadillidium nasatum TaxID=96803 RepID=A0A5N5SVR5_9CRUS|nr:Protein RCC2-like protein [Armadillidium nasatum]